MAKIDVHHHVLPQFFRDAQTAGGYPSTAYRDFPDWSPATSLALMDRLDIATSMVSFSAPGIWYGDAAATADLARRCNDYLVECREKHPGRFGGFACLPLPDVDASLREIERAMDTLKLDGFVHLTHVDNRFAGHADYAPVYDELNRRQAVVFLHPTYPPKAAERDYPTPRPIVDYPCETTRAVTHLLFTGTLERCPDIRFIVSHAGGALTVLAHRIALFDELTPHRRKYPGGAMRYLRRLYYDTALSGDSAVLTALQALVGPTQILFGTDYPYIPDSIAESETRGTDAHAGFTAGTRAMMEHGNAKALFPRLR
ncbi:MAG: amidohydrolase family protein [Rhodospirillales bacterium]